MMLLLAAGVAGRHGLGLGREPAVVRAARSTCTGSFEGTYGVEQGRRGVAHRRSLTLFAFVAIALFASLLVAIGVFD